MLLPYVSPAFAVEVYLKNGDRWSGEIVSQDDHVLHLTTGAAGTVAIDKTFIDGERTYPEKAAAVSPAGTAPPTAVTKPKVDWHRNIAMAYTKTTGNTHKNQAMGSAQISRKTAENEAALKFDALYSSSEGRVDAKKFYGLLRYADSFGVNLKSYMFYKLEGQQDRFAGIDYRLIPSIGLGYWFADTNELKAMLELAAGYQYTNYRLEEDDEGEAVLVPRFFIDKRLLERLHLSEDLTVYPSLSNPGDFRYRSETALINQINERWSVKMQYISEYDSAPSGAARKLDSTWITSLDYNF